MTLAKYNEIMDHVEMTEEMKNRILSHADHHFAKRRRRKTIRIVLPVIGMAAAAAVILLVAKPWSGRNTVQSTETATVTGTPNVTGGVSTGGAEPGTEDMAPGIYHMTEYPSAEELEKAAGFSVKELKAVPFTVTDRSYRLISGSIAEEEYRGTKEELTYRKAKGTEDRSGVYTEYKVNKPLDVRGTRLNLSGDGSLISLVRWTDGKYAYSLYSEQGITEKDVCTLAEEIIE